MYNLGKEKHELMWEPHENDNKSTEARMAAHKQARRKYKKKLLKHTNYFELWQKLDKNATFKVYKPKRQKACITCINDDMSSINLCLIYVC